MAKIIVGAIDAALGVAVIVLSLVKPNNSAALFIGIGVLCTGVYAILRGAGAIVNRRA